jgi:hypothetical protein
MTTDSPKHVLEFYQSVIGAKAHDIPVTTASTLPALRVAGYDTARLGCPWTVVTCGMSTQRLNVPADAVDAAVRAELISYVPSIEREFTWWLAWLAEFPFIDQTWIGSGHTISSNAPLFPHSELRHFLFLPPLVRAHRDMGARVRVAGDRVDLWWVVPITDAEREFKLKHGIDALLDVFQAQHLPLVLNPGRRSLV